jgi:2-oxoglutarate ferredoxin oxidoreductase subunit alpha
VHHQVDPNRVNDFAFKLANVNGTGSASANGLLMQAIFRMGIPVSGKNLFPSNIQGLPTWYEIRVNKDGYTARTPRVRPDGGDERGHLREGHPQGGALRRLGALRLELAAPDKLCAPTSPSSACRSPSCATAPSRACGAHPDEEHRLRRRARRAARHRHRRHPRAAQEKFSKKPALLASNDKAIALGYNYAKDHFQCPLPIRLETDGRDEGLDPHRRQHRGRPRLRVRRRDGGRVVPDHAVHLVMEAFKGFCEKYRVDKETGKKNYASSRPRTSSPPSAW